MYFIEQTFSLWTERCLFLFTEKDAFLNLEVLFGLFGFEAGSHYTFLAGPEITL